MRAVLLLVMGMGLPVTLGAQGAYPAARHGGNYMHNYYFPPAPSSSPWAPAWAPGGDRIAVGMSGSIWVVDPRTGSATELTSDSRYHSSPTWSPDGRWIVYTSDDGGQTIRLEAVEVETGQTHVLTDTTAIYTDPVFSPSGDRLAYVSTAPNGYFNVYVRPIREGRWAGDAVGVTSDHDYGRDRLYFGPWDMHIAPAWMPDGDELLIVSNRNLPLGSGDVWRVPARQGGIEDARAILHEQSLYRTRPHVSIDGRRFVYSSTAGTADQFNNLYVQPTDGGEPYKLTLFRHDAFHPRWSPDGEWIAYIDNRDGLPQLALLETYGGRQRIVRITERRWRRPTGRLAVRVLDEAGAGMAARIHLVAADGRSYAPADAYARVGYAGDHLFHAEDGFELELPVGPVQVVAVRGFEYQPDTAVFDVVDAETTVGTIRLGRIADMEAIGWFSGSTHVHMNYGGNLRNSLDNMLMMSAAEDQDIVNEQIANKDNRVLDHEFFVPGGGSHPESAADRLLVVGQEYRPPFYGHVFMLGLRDHLISPYTTGYEGTGIESLYPSNTDMLRKAKAQGATTGYVHPFGGDADPLEGTLGGGKGFMVDAALGTTDALEWSLASRAGFFPLYAVWNNGFRVTAVGGEDSITDLQRSKLVGSIRTYVCPADGAFNSASWYEGLRMGRAVVSNGPLIDFRVNGSGPGASIALPAGGGTVAVRATVRSIVPLARIVLVANGERIDEVSPPGDRQHFTYEADVDLSASAWMHLLVEGAPEERFPLDVAYAQAFTNPVWITVDGQPHRSREGAEYGVRWIDRLEALARDWPDWRSDAEIAHVTAQFDEARHIYRQRGAEAPERMVSPTPGHRSVRPGGGMGACQ